MRLFLIGLLALSFCYASQAQDCKGFYYLTNGQVKMTVYDKKAKESGIVTYTVSGVAKTSGALTANFASEMVDSKGKSVSKGSGKYKCSGGIIYVDASVAMPQEQMSAYKDMEIKAETSFIEYPATLSEGQILKDANFSMDINNKGSHFATITFTESNRKVNGKESITTPAGTWNCWKISYDGKVKSQTMGINIPFNFQVTEWFAPGFGIVKTETSNKNGKLVGSTLITAVQK